MKVRRFTASSMQKALKTVRDEMGPDAVILSNHRVKGGVVKFNSMWLNFFDPRIEEVAL